MAKHADAVRFCPSYCKCDLLAIEVHPEKGPATWLEPVSDEDYTLIE